MIPTPLIPSGHFPLIGEIGPIGPSICIAERSVKGYFAPGRVTFCTDRKSPNGPGHPLLPLRGNSPWSCLREGGFRFPPSLREPFPLKRPISSSRTSYLSPRPKGRGSLIPSLAPYPLCPFGTSPLDKGSRPLPMEPALLGFHWVPGPLLDVPPGDGDALNGSAGNRKR